MPYKHEEEVKSVVYGYARYSADDTVIDEVDEVYKKSKVFDEIETAYWKSNAPDNFAYEFVKIYREHFDKDLERDTHEG